MPGAALGPAPQAILEEEILVRARKREVALQEAPVAVSVLSGGDFDKSGIVRLDNLNGYLPGLVVAKNDGAGRIAAIRGIGWETAQNLATQPSVLTYIDGVYLANPLALGLDLGELERVEVFRGPQGTEFGQGTTGGAQVLELEDAGVVLSQPARVWIRVQHVLLRRGMLIRVLGECLGERGEALRGLPQERQLAGGRIGIVQAITIQFPAFDPGIAVPPVSLR